jgi:uncharacterized protein (TIGR02145 family)
MSFQHTLIVLTLSLLFFSCVKESIPETEYRTITDVDGNVYKTVRIGDQWWMTENLKTTKYNDGTSIALISQDTEWNASIEPSYCFYANDAAAYGTQYGALYNFYAVIGGEICPSSWRVPSDTDWFTLENFVDPSIDNPSTEGYRGSYAGKYLKSTIGWESGSDNFHFNALPGGYRSLESSFTDVGYRTYFWTSTTASSNWSWFRSLKNGSDQISRSKYVKRMGCYVRCVKDAEITD